MPPAALTLPRPPLLCPPPQHLRPAAGHCRHIHAQSGLPPFLLPDRPGSRDETPPAYPDKHLPLRLQAIAPAPWTTPLPPKQRDRSSLQIVEARRCLAVKGYSLRSSCSWLRSTQERSDQADPTIHTRLS